MKLTYEMLKQNVVLVKVLNPLEIADAIDYFNEEEIAEIKSKHKHIIIREDNAIIIEPGFEWEINVQPFNYHYELTRLDLNFDCCFDTDEDLNENLELIRIVKPNHHFVK